MAWLILIPMAYLCLATPIATFRLLHRPRFPKACFAVIAISIVISSYESYLFLNPSSMAVDLIEAWLWLLASIPIQLVLLILAFIPNKAQANDQREP